MSRHRLAAIMFTDIVGYTSLMSSNERKAIDIIKKNRRIHWRLIKKYRGKWLKEMGDGTLASFSSNVDAVMCAVSIQKATSELDIPLRIGIHQGDVIFEQADILGDGVNVASRIQGLAEAGGIAVSETVYNEIKNKEGLESEFQGEQVLKGLESPIGIYKISCHDFSLLDYSIDTGELIKPLNVGKTKTIFIITLIIILAYSINYFMPLMKSTEFEKSIMVLPFNNFTGNDSLDYVFESMHASLIGDLGRIGKLRVISPYTSKKYKDSGLTLAQIAAEQNIDVFLDASVLCFGDSICFQPSLISIDKEEKQLWSDRYTKDFSQILNLNNEVTREITAEIDVTLTPQEENLLTESRTVNPDAYEAYLRGMRYWGMGKKEDLEKAQKYFELSLEIDPNYALAHLGMSSIYGGLVIHGFMSPAEAKEAKEKSILKAFELDSNLVEVRTSFALRYTWGKWNWKRADIEFRKAIEINPNYPFVIAYYGQYLTIIGQIEKGLKYSEKAMRLDPLNSLYHSIHGMNLKNARKYNEALILLEKLCENEPEQGIGLPALWAVYHELEQYDKALKIAKRIYNLKGNEQATTVLDAGYNEGGYNMAMQRTAEMMINLSDSTYIPPWQICTLYCRAEMKNEALDWLEKAFNEHDPNMTFISVDPLFDFLREEERFKEILESMNLPLSK
ncbi:MAG: adenylate/guanylate cyclase domain-containing protein [Bacteroidota bacterium]